jgi:hypothetical protein
VRAVFEGATEGLFDSLLEKSSMPSRLLLLTGTLALLLLACGDDSSSRKGDHEGAAGDAARGFRVVVTGKAGENQALEGRLAGRIFWSPLRKSALAMVANVEAQRLRPWGPAFLDECEARLRADVLGMRGLDAARCAERIHLERHRLKAPFRPGSRILDFVSGEAGQRWTGAVHPRSPGGQFEGVIAVRREEFGLGDRQALNLLVVSSELPSVKDLADAKARGAAAWAVAEDGAATSPAAQVESYRDPEGFSGEMLPLPLLFVDANTAQVICRRSGSGGFQIQLRIEDGNSEATPAEALVLSLRAPASQGHIVVTAGREALSLGPGSSSLAAANLISMARAIASVIGDAKRPTDLALDVDFVFVADGETGFDFLREVRGRGPLYGVIEVGDLIPESAQSSDLLLALGGLDGRLEDAALSAAQAYARRPSQAWNSFGVTAAAAPPSAALAKDLGFERLPFLRLEMARRGDRRAFSWMEGLERSPRDLQFAPPALTACRGPGDTFSLVGHDKLVPHVALARLALISIVRAQAGLGDS